MSELFRVFIVSKVSKFVQAATSKRYREKVFLNPLILPKTNVDVWKFEYVPFENQIYLCLKTNNG